MTNKDNAIRLLDAVKPRSLGSGIRTASLDQVAAQRSVSSDLASKEVMDKWIKESKEGNKGNHWISLVIALGVVGLAIALIKLKVIKL